MLGGVDEDGLFQRVDAVAHEAGIDAGKTALERAGAVDHVDERRIQPGAHDARRCFRRPLPRELHSRMMAAARGITGFQIGREGLAVHVQHLGALGAQRFGNEQAQQLFRPCRARGMELDRFDVISLAPAR